MYCTTNMKHNSLTWYQLDSIHGQLRHLLRFHIAYTYLFLSGIEA